MQNSLCVHCALDRLASVGVMVWIGLNHLKEGWGWQWSDGAPLALVNFTTGALSVVEGLPPDICASIVQRQGLRSRGVAQTQSVLLAALILFLLCQLQMLWTSQLLLASIRQLFISNAAEAKSK